VEVPKGARRLDYRHSDRRSSLIWSMPDRMRSRFRHALTALRRVSLRGSEDGATLVEFSLIFPIFMILFMAVIEFSLAFNATLGINRASQDAALVASEAGNTPGGDCLILQTVEDEVGVPNRKASIITVQVQRTGPGGGNIYASNVYSRTGSMSCTLNDGSTVTVPYTATSTGYPSAQRCNIVAGCPTLTPVRTTVDNIAVQIRYTYTYQTPVGSLSNMLWNDPMGGSWTFQKRNVFRMEPIL
jgi:Flp pilus assembly protein TadG